MLNKIELWNAMRMPSENQRSCRNCATAVEEWDGATKYHSDKLTHCIACMNFGPTALSHWKWRHLK